MERISSIYIDVRSSLGLSWCGELVECLAPFDRYLQAAWVQLRPNAVSAYFRRVVEDVQDRSRAVVLESGLPFTDHHAAIAAAGGHQAAAALELTLAAVAAVHPPSLLIATACRDALLGREVGSSPPRTGPDAVVEDARPPSLTRRLSAPRDGFDTEPAARAYQFFTDQPEYLEMVRRELRHLLKADQYRRGIAELDAYATAAMRALPFPFRAGGELARAMGYSAATVARLLELVTEQQARSCELCLQFSALRFAWEGGNVTEA